MKKIIKILSILFACSCLIAIASCKEKSNKNNSEVSSINSSVKELCSHVFKSEITKEATCKEKGTTLFTCHFCNASYTEEIEKTQHNYAQKCTKYPTATSVGIYTYTCSICNDSYYRHNYRYA